MKSVFHGLSADRRQAQAPFVPRLAGGLNVPAVGLGANDARMPAAITGRAVAGRFRQGRRDSIFGWVACGHAASTAQAGGLAVGAYRGGSVNNIGHGVFIGCTGLANLAVDSAKLACVGRNRMLLTGGIRFWSRTFQQALDIISSPIAVAKLGDGALAGCG
jgi:hypothetical protein